MARLKKSEVKKTETLPNGPFLHHTFDSLLKLGRLFFNPLGLLRIFQYYHPPEKCANSKEDKNQFYILVMSLLERSLLGSDRGLFFFGVSNRTVRNGGNSLIAASRK